MKASDIAAAPTVAARPLVPAAQVPTVAATTPAPQSAADASTATARTDAADAFDAATAAAAGTPQQTKHVKPDTHTQTKHNEDEEVCEPLPPVQALQGMMKLGGRLKGQILSWEGMSTQASAPSQACILSQLKKALLTCFGYRRKPRRYPPHPCGLHPKSLERSRGGCDGSW